VKSPKTPSAFYNKTIAVRAEVEDIVSPNSFTLDEDKLTSTQDLLVLNTTPGQTINDGQEVVVTAHIPHPQLSQGWLGLMETDNWCYF
jgi:hypothetical protein